MTTVETVMARRGGLERLRWAVADSAIIAKRNVTIWFRVPALIVFTVVQPVMFTLLFRYVFGGAIPIHTPGGYVDYLMPGVIGQTAAFASIGTAIALAIELRRGGIDRIRSMPTARSAVLVGRLTSDLLRMLVTIGAIIAVGYCVGFAFRGGAFKALEMVGLAALFGLAVCCVSAFIGLAIKDEESVQAFGLIWLFPLTFVSSAFVPIQTMPGWLQAFANHQPVTLNRRRHAGLGHQQHGRHAREPGLGYLAEPGLDRRDLRRLRAVGRARLSAGVAPGGAHPAAATTGSGDTMRAVTGCRAWPAASSGSPSCPPT
jgi:ABC transporter DrrB family efflux protein